MDVVIDFSHVQGERASVRWAHPISFQLERGQYYLIRTNSTLSSPMFRLCLGFSDPSVGDVRVEGRAPHAMSRYAVRDFRRTIGCVFEPDGLVANLTLKMNLVVPLVFATGLEYEEAMARADSMLQVMHLSMWADVRPAALPAEIRQTAALARALCPRPALLLLENPLASVDDKETRRLMSLCRAQAETLLVITHRYDSVLNEFSDASFVWDDDGFRTAA